MMKWLMLAGIALITTGCCYTTTEVVQYRQVTVMPVVQPVILDVDNPEPLDVTTTTIDFY
jgi:hypothetical protein